MCTKPCLKRKYERKSSFHTNSLNEFEEIKKKSKKYYDI